MPSPVRRSTLCSSTTRRGWGGAWANRYRADLEAAGIGDGRHGFQFDFPIPLPPAERHVIRVCREADGTDLEGSPAILEAPPPSIADARDALAGILAGLPDGELEPTIDLLADHLEKALPRLADRDSFRARRREYRQFLERWRRRGPDDARAADPQPGAPVLRALVIDDRLPKADRGAGSVAILSHIRSLQRLGFEVTFVAALDFAAAPDSPAPPQERAALEALGVLSCAPPYYASVEEVLRRQAGEFDLVYLHRIANAAKYGELARHHCPEARLVYSVADLHHLRLARQAQQEDRPELLGTAQRLRLLEFTAAALADVVITHSSDESALLQAQLLGGKVQHRAVVGLRRARTPVPFAQRSGIALHPGAAATRRTSMRRAG